MALGTDSTVTTNSGLPTAAESDGGQATLPNDLLKKIASKSSEILPCMRLVCRAWNVVVDECTTILCPALCQSECICTRFPGLRQLDLSGCPLTVSDAKLAQLMHLSALQILVLKGCDQVTLEGIQALRFSKSLQHLQLGNDPDAATDEEGDSFDSKVTDEMLHALAGVQSLTSLHIGFSCKCTKAGALQLTALTGLRSLSIMGHSPLDFGRLGSADIHLLASLTRLSVLRLGVVSAKGFEALPHFGTRLISLDLYGDTWERSPLGTAELGRLTSLAELTHLGLHHYEIAGTSTWMLAGQTSLVDFTSFLSKLVSWRFDGCNVDSSSELALLHSSCHIRRVQIKLAVVEEDSDDDAADAQEASQSRNPPELPFDLSQQEEWDMEELDIQASANVLHVTNEALSHMSRLVSLKMELAKPPDPVIAFAASNLNIDRWASRDVLGSLSMGSRVPLNAANVAALSGFTTLTTLACTVVEFLPVEIARLQSLRELCVSWASGGDAGMEGIGKLTRLVSLKIGCQDVITDTGCQHLSSLTSLTELIFHSTCAEPKISGVGLQALACLTGLVRLELVSRVELDPAAIHSLAPLTGLRHLAIGNVASITDAVLEAVAPLGKLRKLWVRIPKERMWQQREGSIQVTKRGMASLARAHAVLSFLCFGNSQMLSFPHWAIDHGMLQELAIADKNNKLDSVEDSLFWS